MREPRHAGTTEAAITMLITTTVAAIIEVTLMAPRLPIARASSWVMPIAAARPIAAPADAGPRPRHVLRW